MNNKEFLEVVKKSFYKYLETSSRSNEKLKILHGAIANDISDILGEEYYVHALGINDSKEVKMQGRYMNKTVDIAIEKDKKILAAIGLKFIMSNYSQNSNNYFENMLGETANIRSNGGSYFQILIIPSKVPYFDKNGVITNYETITAHNLEKYILLSEDNPDAFMHTPNKTLVCLIDIPTECSVNDKNKYKEYYDKNKEFEIVENKTEYEFKSSVVYNDYMKFIEKVCYYIKSL